MHHIAHDKITSYGYVASRVWQDLEQHIVDIVTDQWRRRLTACVSAKDRHFEHNL